MNCCSLLSDKELLVQLIGVRKTRKLYRGALTPAFVEAERNGDGYRKLAAARELVRRLITEELKRGPLFEQPDAAREYLRVTFAGRHYESFVLLFLDNRHRLIAAEELFRGTLNGTAVYPREIVKRALELNAAALIFGHNHPSGIAEPSRADEILTTRLKESLSLIDVRVLDHVVIAGIEAVSFAERGMI